MRATLVRRQGFTMIEVLLVAGGIAAMGLIVASLTTQSNRAVKGVKQYAEWVTFDSSIQMIINTPSACAATFQGFTMSQLVAGTPPFTQFKNLSGTAVIQKDVARDGLAITELGFTDITPAPTTANLYMGNLNIAATKVGPQGAQGMGGNRYTKSYPIRFTTSADNNTIVGCASTSEEANAQIACESMGGAWNSSANPMCNFMPGGGNPCPAGEYLRGWNTVGGLNTADCDPLPVIPPIPPPVTVPACPAGDCYLTSSGGNLTATPFGTNINPTVNMNAGLNVRSGNNAIADFRNGLSGVGGRAFVSVSNAGTTMSMGVMATPTTAAYVQTSGQGIYFADADLSTPTLNISVIDKRVFIPNWSTLENQGSTVLDASKVTYTGTWPVGPAGGNHACLVGGNKIGICASNVRYKTDIKDLLEEDALAMLLRLRPVSYRWKKEGLPDIGLISEEAFAVDPRLAGSDEKGAPRSLNNFALTALSIKGIQALEKRLTRLEEENERLKAELKSLKK